MISDPYQYVPYVMQIELSVQGVRDTVHTPLKGGMKILLARPRICLLPTPHADTAGVSRENLSHSRPWLTAADTYHPGDAARRKV